MLRYLLSVILFLILFSESEAQSGVLTLKEKENIYSTTSIKWQPSSISRVIGLSINPVWSKSYTYIDLPVEKLISRVEYYMGFKVMDFKFHVVDSTKTECYYLMVGDNYAYISLDKKLVIKDSLNAKIALSQVLLSQIQNSTR